MSNENAQWTLVLSGSYGKTPELNNARCHWLSRWGGGGEGEDPHGVRVPILDGISETLRTFLGRMIGVESICQELNDKQGLFACSIFLLENVDVPPYSGTLATPLHDLKETSNILQALAYLL